MSGAVVSSRRRSEVPARGVPARGVSARGVVGRAAADRGGGRGDVAEIQRVRMIAALVEVAGERGAGGVTVTHIVARSGVSRRTFYELFADRDACFLAALDQAVALAAQRVLPAFRAPGSWKQRIRVSLTALLEFLDDEPGMGRLCVVDALGAGHGALARRAAVIESLIEAVDDGRGEARRGAPPARLTAEGVVGAVLAILHARLLQPDHGSMIALLGPLMGVIILPYQGPAAAAREAAKPAPRRREPAVRAPGDPLRDLDMRLTYRTVRVLVAIADNPGASNRTIADASGVLDQGQISKLLTRLQHLGLIYNDGIGPSRGEPNVWSLTPRGEEVQHTIHQQAVPH